jgi:hypothetical protein
MKYILLLFLCIHFCQCGVLHNGFSYFGEEKIFSKQFKFYPLNSRSVYGREPGWELGFAFKPHKEGRLKGLWLKNPTIGKVPVSIWDADTKQLIKTLECNNIDTINYNHFLIPQPLLLIAEKKYCITANVIKYYYQSLPFTPLPLECNNCTLLSSVYEETYYQRFPQFEIHNIIHGLLDVDIDWKL